MKGSTEVKLPATGDEGPLRWITHEDDTSLIYPAAGIRRIGSFSCSALLLQQRFGLPTYDNSVDPVKFYWTVLFTMPDGMQFQVVIAPDRADLPTDALKKVGWYWNTDWIIEAHEKAACTAVFCALWDVLNAPRECDADPISLRKEPT